MHRRITVRWYRLAAPFVSASAGRGNGGATAARRGAASRNQAQTLPYSTCQRHFDFTALPDDTSNGDPDNSPLVHRETKQRRRKTTKPQSMLTSKATPRFNFQMFCTLSSTKKNSSHPKGPESRRRGRRTSRQLLKEFARFKRFNVAAIESKQKKSTTVPWIRYSD